jgi:hypothetical protein
VKDDVADECERLLAVYREDDAPDDAAIDRVVARLGGSPGAAPSWMDRAPAITAAPASRVGLSIAIATVALAAAAAAVLWHRGVIGDARVAEQDRDSASYDAPTRAATDAVVRDDGATRPARPASSTPVADTDPSLGPAELPAAPPPASPSSIAAEAPRPTAGASTSAATNPDPKSPDPKSPDPKRPDPTSPDPKRPNPKRPDPTSPDPKSPDPKNPDPTGAARSLADELAKIAAAEAALREGRITRTLQLLDEHRRSHPQGELAPEAAALRIVARCELGATGATQAAARWLADNASTTSRRRIAIACGLDDADEKSTGTTTTPARPGH